MTIKDAQDNEMDLLERLRATMEALEHARDRLLVDQSRADEEGSRELDPLIASLHDGVQELSEEIARRRQAQLEQVSEEQAEALVQASHQLQNEIVVRQRSDVALQSAIQLNRVMLDTALAALAQVARDGTVLKANTEATRLLSLSYDSKADRFHGDWESRLIQEDGTPCAEGGNPLRDCLRTGVGQPSRVLGLRRANGTIWWAVFRAAPLFDQAGSEVRGAVLSALDVSEKKRLETDAAKT